MTDAERLIRLLEELERNRTTVLELVCGTRTPEPWRLYPGEYGIFSRKTRSQFYFHTHGDDRDEAGHFHTVRLFSDRTAHLVAISMASSGWPQALFTVNLWAIGDAEDTPENLKRYARRFQIEERHGDPRVIRFVNLVFRVFLPEIERLQDQKTAAFAAHRLAHPDTNSFEDRSLEILSRVAIDVRDVLLVADPLKDRRASGSPSHVYVGRPLATAALPAPPLWPPKLATLGGNPATLGEVGGQRSAERRGPADPAP